MRIIPENTRSGLLKGMDAADFIIGLAGAFCTFAAYSLNSGAAGAIAFALAATLLLWRTRYGKTYLLVYGLLLHLAYRKKFVKMETPELLVCVKPEGNGGSGGTASPKRDFSAYDVPVGSGEALLKPNLKSRGRVYDIRDITAFTDIENGLIRFGEEYFAAVLEIFPVDFQFLGGHKRKAMIDDVLAVALRSISVGQGAQLIKLERPVLFDSHIAGEAQKLERIKEAYLNAQLNELELSSGVAILSERLDAYEYWNGEEKIYRGRFYLALFAPSSGQLRRMAGSCETTLKNGGIPCKRLGDMELAVFLRYQYSRDFDEREIETVDRESWNDWILPERLEFRLGRTITDSTTTRTLRVNGYPKEASAAWGQGLFSQPDTKVVMQISPVTREGGLHRLNRELAWPSLADEDVKAKRRESLANILSGLRGAEECLFDINTCVTVYDASNAALSTVRRALQDKGIHTEELLFRQFFAHAATGVSAYDPFGALAVGMPSVSVAAAFPFVAAIREEQAGINLGLSNAAPVFLNLFKRDDTHRNSNVIIIGREGSGRSYAMKALLSNLFAEDTRVFVADTESKYANITKKINGRVLDVSNAADGRLNPLHVHPSMAGTASGEHGGFAAHMEFLEEFFAQLLPAIDSEQRELLLALIANVYEKKGISAKSDFYALTPQDFPTLEDVAASIDPAMSMADTPLGKALALIKTTLGKLTLDIRGPALYGGYESLSPTENFVAFDFRGLLENPRAAAAHLLLLLNWLEGEIVRNFEYNRMCNASRKAVVVLDEAHALFVPKTALVQGALLRFAGRIARYNGMLALCTRNLKAFAGTGEAAEKATALVGACQYSFIFPIKAEDTQRLLRLYEGKAELSEAECGQIAQNPRGTAYVISGPDDRTCVQIAAYPEVTTLI